MREANRSLFRAEAVRRYAQSREKVVLPRLVAPRTFLCLWLLLGLLVAAGVAAWSTRVPIYASGSAVVVAGARDERANSDDVLVVAFISPDNLARLHVGQTLWLRLDPAGELVSRPIIAVDPEITSPMVAQQRFSLSANAALAITQPAAVVIARLGSPPMELPLAAYVGGVYRVEIEVGSRKVLSLLPLADRFGV